MEDGSEKRAVLIAGEGSLSPSPLLEKARQLRANKKSPNKVQQSVPAHSEPSKRQLKSDGTAVYPNVSLDVSQGARAKIEQKRKELEQSRTLPSSGEVFIATGPSRPEMTVDGVIIKNKKKTNTSTKITDPTFGFKEGVSQFSNGDSEFTNRIFTSSSPDWTKTKYGSHDEFLEASKAVQSEIASGGHALFRADPSNVGKGYLGKHDPVLSVANLRERLNKQTILGIGTGMPTSTSSKFTSYKAFNQSENMARTEASLLLAKDTAKVGVFKGQASYKATSDFKKDIGISVEKGKPGTTMVKRTQVSLNSSLDPTQVKTELNAGRASTVPWTVAQHFPTK
ncbi:hypothetical protein [Agarivorans sp. QJM3NY_33]|uniref:hypothetical protein n=1 Tax=Agarivorans sp. QJM3NY_33 TaxID=3421432 RepID=UPI003D7D8E98